MCSAVPTPREAAGGSSLGHGHASTPDENRTALRLQKAEHALEQERLASAQLRRQLDAAMSQLQQHRQAASASGEGAEPSHSPHMPGGATPSGSERHSGGGAAPHSLSASGRAASGGGAGSGATPAGTSPPSPGSLLHFPMLSEAEQLQRELAVAQTQLLQRTVEAERLRRAAAEQEGEANKLRAQLQQLVQAGGATMQLKSQVSCSGEGGGHGDVRELTGTGTCLPS